MKEINSSINQSIKQSVNQQITQPIIQSKKLPDQSFNQIKDQSLS